MNKSAAKDKEKLASESEQNELAESGWWKTRKNDFDRESRTDNRITILADATPWPMTLIFNPLQAVVMILILAKNEGWMSGGSKVMLETDGRTRPIALPSQLTWSVITAEENMLSLTLKSVSVKWWPSRDRCVV